MMLQCCSKKKVQGCVIYFQPPRVRVSDARSFELEIIQVVSFLHHRRRSLKPTFYLHHSSQRQDHSLAQANMMRQTKQAYMLLEFDSTFGSLHDDAKHYFTERATKYFDIPFTQPDHDEGNSRERIAFRTLVSPTYIF